jgi:hypothetical protein
LHMTSMDLLDEIPHVMKPFDKIVWLDWNLSNM